MKEIKKIDILSLAKFQGALGLVAGVFVAIAFSLLGRGGMGVFMLFFYVISSFVGGAIIAFIYNKYTEAFGGIKIELK